MEENGMSDQIIGVTIKGIGDFSDVVSNVNSVQKALTKLKLPDKLGDSLSKNIANFTREYEKYQQKVAGGIKTQGDFNSVSKSLNMMLNSYERIINDFNKIPTKDFKDIFKMDEGAFANIRSQIKSMQAELDKLKVDPNKITAGLNQIRGVTKSTKLVGDNGIFKQFEAGLAQGGPEGFEKIKAAMADLEAYYDRFKTKMSSSSTTEAWSAGLGTLRSAIQNAEGDFSPLLQRLQQVEQKFNEMCAKGQSDLASLGRKLLDTSQAAGKVTQSLMDQHKNSYGFERQAQMLSNQIQMYFGLTQIIRKVGNIAKSAFNTVKDLDKAMTETAVVTNFSVGDMWEKLPIYTEQANKLGSTIKDVYEASTLYYQQGLNTNQAMGLANETLKMARIAGMDAAEATDMMTAALRGFNMEVNQVSAQRINDVYSKLAAITASNTQEIGTAMEKTASLANSANMDFETTSAFLSQMIETTREAPENLGTAMKTIIARFQEMKKDPTQLVDSEGVAMDVNKIDTALKSIGVALTNTKGEFRDLDDVFLDISAKWDSLSQGQQRYIATTAAGSRQQSRFIAMMSNHERTMELVEAANNSAGASQAQFEKTMDSMSSKMNQLKNAWDQFAMGLMNNQILKAGVDGLTKFFTAVNKIIDALGKIPPKPFEGVTKSLLTLGATLTGLNFAKNLAFGATMMGVGWYTGEGTSKENFLRGYKQASGHQNVKTKDKVYTEKLEMWEEKQRQREEKLSQREEAKPVIANVSAKVGVSDVDTSGIDEPVRNEVKEEIENGPVVEGNVPAKVGATPVPAGNRMPFQRSADGTLHYTNSKGESMQPVPTQQDMSKEGSSAEQAGKGAKEATKSFTGLGSSIAQTGFLLQRLGSQMGPLGAGFSAIGSVMMTLGTTMGIVSQAYTTSFEAQKKKILANAEESVSTKLVSNGNLTAAGTFKAMGIAIWESMGPLLAIVVAIGALIAIYYALDKAIVTDKERLEEASDAAARASEAYNSAKQELSELTDALDQIQTGEDAFDGLVAGTAEFNEKLVEVNQRIAELIAKYPELIDFVTTDENGLMHISQEGIDKLKEQQQQIVGNASAMNVLQSAQLKAEEARQEAKTIRKESKEKDAEEKGFQDRSSGGYVDAAVLGAEVREEDERRAKLKEQEANALERMSKQQAIMNSLTKLESADKEKIAKIYEGSYDAMLKQAKTEKDIHKMRKAYADYYGYEYSESRGKITDSEGKEVEGITDEVVKDAFPEINVLANIEANGESLDKLASSIDSTFSKQMGVNLTDILSSNIETDEDALQKLIQDPSGIQEAISQLEEKEIAALLNISEEEVSKDVNKYADQLADNTEERAKAILEAQTQVNSELGAMMAQAQYADTNFHQQGWQQIVVSSISEQISKLTVEQRNMLNTVGKTLKENVGADAMSTFLNEASSIYLSKDKSLINEFDNVLDGINWDSATSRLEGYNKMMRSTQSEIRQMGEDMRKSSNEANLLGESFEEFLGGDWLNLSENADDFKNAVGEIDGAGILKAAESSRQLKAMLDSGEVSASGLAMTLQGVEDGSILQVNDAVLQLLSSLNKVADVALEAHNIVENFDPGIDYGEGEDFMIENAKKVKEYMDNGEWGNEQLQNYIKMAAGQERWDKALAKHKGNLAETTRDLQHYATDFSEGTANVWDKLVNKKGADGDTFEHNLNTMEDKALKKRFKKAGVNFDWGGEDGTLRVEIGNLTTEEFEQYLQQVGGMSEDYAKLMIQDLANYDATVSSTLRANDIQAMGDNPELKENRTNKETGQMVFTSEELDTIKALSGEDGLKSLAKGLKISLEELKESSLQTTKEDGTERTDYKRLMGDYYRAYYDSESKGLQNIINEFSENGQFNIGKLIEDAISKGLSDEQALQGAYKAYEESGGSALYEGMEIEAGLSFEEFSERMEEITESSQWVTVGETIGQQIVSAMERSNLLQEVDRGEAKQAIDSSGKTSKTFGDVVQATRESDSSGAEKREILSDYLRQSQETFKNLKPEEQAQALQGIVQKLNEFNFKPESIASIIKDGLGINLSTDGRGALQGETGEVTLDPKLMEQTLKVQATEQLNGLEAVVSNVEIAKNAISESNPFEQMTANITGIFKGFTDNKYSTKATGQNNPNSIFHRTGTMARGSRGGYTISGRPTLTGEEGEELVWEPKQNRAFMVGSNGPQFANISKSAVVWNADQTKRIKKNSGNISSFGTGARGINNFGTMAEGTKVPGVFTADVTGNITETVPPKKTPEVPVIGKLQIENNTKESEGGKKKGGFSQTITNDLTLNSLVKNPEEPKDKIKAVVPKKHEGTIQASFTLSSKVKTGNLKGELQSSANKASKGLKVKAGTTSTVKTDIDNTAQKKIDKIKRAKPVEVKTKATDTAQKAINNISGKSVEVKVTPNFGANSNWTKTITIKRKGGKGKAKEAGEEWRGTGYHTPYQSLPSIASAASGRYGRLGPNGKGGPTLTGEKGYEIAWIPSESRSMILGANGPQMIDLPPDTVVWTHEQSKRIMSQKAIPAGSHEKPRMDTGKKRSTSNKNSSTKTKTTNSKGGGGGGSDKKTTKKHKTNADSAEKIIKKAGRVIVWWENQERKVDAIQREIDKNQKAFEKALSAFGATFESVGDATETYIKNLNKSIALNKESRSRAKKTLTNISTKTATEKANDKAARKAQKQLDKAKKTKTKKDDKKAEKNLKKAQKKQKGASYKNITWEETKKKGKKTEKVKKKDRINLADYITKDPDTGAYVIDQGALDRVGKKSKAKAKAIKEAATKAIETPQGRYNTADDNITKAQDALDEITQKLYDTFLGWEIELTKIWNLTQKISNVEAKTSRLKEALSLQEAQMASGYAKASSSFNEKTLSTFSAQMKTMNESISTRGNLIEEQKKKLGDLFTGVPNKNTLANVTEIINKATAKASHEETVAELKKKAKQQEKNAAKYNDKIAEQQNKKERAKNKIAEIKNNKKLSAEEKKRKIEEQKAIINNANALIDNYKLKVKEAEQSSKNYKSQINKEEKDYQAKGITSNISDKELELRKKEKEELENQEKLRKDALKYLTYSQNGDGTYNISFDTDRFETDKENLGISADYGKKIEEYVKDIQSLNEELNNSYTEQTQALTELYTTLSDLQQEQADNANELLDIVENEQQKELEKIRGLSESLNEAIGDLLNEVKERLTERRNREDNLKTEQDISKKQQRLAALRADTSGGHAVEIAQLEKEVADAQQAYGRTLEDQLLDRLQRQADEAAKQRERMIELQEAAAEGASEQSNLAKVNKWMAMIEDLSKGNFTENDKEVQDALNEIKEQWLANEGYDKLPDAAKPITEAKWEEFKTKLLTNFGKQEAVKTSIDDAQAELKNTQTALKNLQDAIKDAPETFTGDPLERVKTKAAEAGKDGVINAAEFLDVAKVANSLGYSARTYMQALADVDDPTGVSELTWEEVIRAAKDADFSAYSMAKSFDSASFIKGFEAVYGTGSYKKYRNNTSKGTAYAYATGGLNTQTGPAWLDGTPTKPELVLNATDTKNFLALRDVLNNVMGSIGSTDNSYRSNDVYNINVNVDKIANDYDVDKMVEKVKKEITKSAGYRNVTQARAFR